MFAWSWYHGLLAGSSTQLQEIVLQGKRLKNKNKTGQQRHQQRFFFKHL